MAPREAHKQTPKAAQPSVAKCSTRNRSSPATEIKKTIAVKKTIEKSPLKMNKTVAAGRQRSSTVPKGHTPKPKENKSVPLPDSVTKSAMKSIKKRRPLGAHSGVPIPHKMKLILQKNLDNIEFSL